MATYETSPPVPGQLDDRDRRPPGNAPRGRSPLPWILLVLGLIVAALLVYFLGVLPRQQRDKKINAEANERRTEKPQVPVQRVQRAPSVSELMIPGTTQAYTEAYIYARSSGYVSRRLADIGDRVHKGQLLAVIDAPDLDRQVAQARSTVEQSQSNLAQLQAQLHLNGLTLDRYRVLVGKGVLSRQDGDQQEANFRVAEANVRASQNNIQANRDNLDRLLVLQQYEHVTAPFDGVITARNIDVGALISTGGSGMGESSAPAVGGTTLAGAQGNNQGVSGTVASSANPGTGGAQGGQMFSEARIDILRILVSVPETYSSAIRIGQQVRLSFQSLPNMPVMGRVTRTSASIDQNTRTLLVEVQASNQGNHFLPGMYVVANFVGLQSSRPLMVPGEAIVVRNGKSMVAVLDEQNVVHMVPVTIGRDYGDQTEIAAGLHENQVVVPSVTDEIRTGVTVEPQFPKTTPKPSPGGQSDKTANQTAQYGNQNASNGSPKNGGGGGGTKQNGGAAGQGGSPKSGGSSAKSEKQ